MSSPTGLSEGAELRAFRFLRSDAGRDALAQAAALGPLTKATHVRIAASLRTHWSAEQVSAVLDTISLRARARPKFSRAGSMWFTRGGLEQASGEVIAGYRAARFAALGLERIADLCCGIGGDAIALARGARVLAVDRDEARLAMAVANAAVYGRTLQPLCTDLALCAPRPVDGVFFDPGRRDDAGRRIGSVHRYRPTLGTLAGWLALAAGAGAKISPAVDYAELPGDASVEFISVDGGLKEAVLWYGALRSRHARTATVLPGSVSLVSDDRIGDPAVEPVGAWLVEPDPAVIRAHLIKELAALVAGARLDPEIAFLSVNGSRPPPSALYKSYRVAASLPFSLKPLRRYLRAHGVATVTVKTRGAAVEPERLIRQLKLKPSAAGDALNPGATLADDHRVLVVTRVAGTPSVLICEAAGAS